MADIRAPPLTASSAKDAAKNIFSDLKSKIPKNLPSGPSEKLQFAKHARGRDGGALNTATTSGEAPQYPQADQMEMQPVNSAELPDYNSVNAEGGYPEGYTEYPQTADGGVVGADGTMQPPPPGGRRLPRGESTWSNSSVGVEGGHDMITQWQAGWNVTNAIQVRLGWY